MANREAKAPLFDALASVAKALGSGRRAEIVDLLAQGERSVEDIAGAIGQSVANTSHHLRRLAISGLLRSRRDGTRILYSLAGPEVEDLWSAVREVAAIHVDRIDRLTQDYLGEPGTLEPLTRDELADRLDRGDVTVIDVRPAEEYEAGHIPGARSIPIDELADRLRTLTKSRDVVAYCRGPYCVYADEAVRELSTRGYRARRLADGFPEWRRDARPVDMGEESG
ncbi:MAG TPA: metalloregulator ArsR/SmtB family transcription factor [Acidimicrobiia bacterium]|nr:metalloregulator ArsR/SmtB family transcription factor [Acidimicrobiia bacterium]